MHLNVGFSGSLGTCIIYPPCYIGGQQFFDCWFKGDRAQRAPGIFVESDGWQCGHSCHLPSLGLPASSFLGLCGSAPVELAASGSFCSWFTEVRLAPGCLAFKPGKFHVPSHMILCSAVCRGRCEHPALTRLRSVLSPLQPAGAKGHQPLVMTCPGRPVPSAVSSFHGETRRRGRPAKCRRLCLQDLLF